MLASSELAHTFLQARVWAVAGLHQLRAYPDHLLSELVDTLGHFLVAFNLQR